MYLRHCIAFNCFARGHCDDNLRALCFCATKNRDMHTQTSRNTSCFCKRRAYLQILERVTILI